MKTGEPALRELVVAIAGGDVAAALGLLRAVPALARAKLEEGATRRAATEHYFTEISHYIYAGDTALHAAAAAYRVEVARALIAGGADVGAKNRRGAEPLHYAADGAPGSATWNPEAQAAVVAVLIEAGADPNAIDASGVAPLHRAVRTRCAAAVGALLAEGADPALANKNGSTPLQLATRTTGRGGSGSPEAKAQQEAILRLLEPRGGRR